MQILKAGDPNANRKSELTNKEVHSCGAELLVSKDDIVFHRYDGPTFPEIPGFWCPCCHEFAPVDHRLYAVRKNSWD
ncbi:MAG TPA: hypothetical protein V6C97_22060 [Oculatellaceae cyanobacterium]